MKKLIKLEFNNTTRERKTEDSYSELYSHDKNNGSFEFEILNDTLTTEQVIALFKFTESNKIWKTTGTVEGNKVKVTFDTSLITQNETVICYLYFDEEQRTADTFRFKFKVKVSEIDKMNRYEVKERFINNTVIVDRLDVVTKTELQEALKNVGGIATEGLLTETKAEEIYAKKSEAVDNTNFELVKNRVLALELKTDKDTVYDDSELKGRISVLEAREDNNTIYDDTNVRERLTALESKPSVDVNNLVTKDELASKNYLTEHQDTSNFALKSEIPQPYNDSALVGRVEALESKQDKDTVYNDTEVKERLTNLENKAPVDLSNLATKEELNEVRNSQPTVDTSNLVTKQELEDKHFLTDQALNNYALKSELYNDSDLKARVEVLEQKTDKDTVYDDTPLKERVTALESKAIEGGAYDDKPIRDRLDVLEAKHDNDTIYDDTEVKRRLTELESKPAVDTSFFVTEEKLASKKYVTEEELNNKAYLTQQNLDSYALKSEIPQPYNDSLLNERVTALESKAIEGGAYNDTDLRNRVINLENKPPLDTSEFVTNQALESRGYIKDVSNLVTKDELENKHFLTTHQSLDHVVTKDELQAKNYISDISNLVTKDELASKKYLTEHQPLTEVKNRLDVLEAKQDKDTVYNDEPIKERLTALETKVDKDTVYNDSELRNRVEVLENKPNVDLSNYITSEQLENKHYLTQHQPLDNLVTKEELNSKGYVTDDVLNSKGYLTEDVLNTKNYLTQHQDLSSLVTKQELENKHYLTEHQPLTHLATTSDLEALRNIAVSKSELSKKLDATEFNSFKDNVVTKSELAEKGYISDLSNYVTKQELHEATEIDYSNIVTTDELDPYAKKSEIPTPYNDSALVSRVSALESKQDKDTVYNDTEVKQRLTALENRPTVGGSQTQDTGWITISDNEQVNNNTVKIRRINDMVHVSLSNPDNEGLMLEGTDDYRTVLVDKTIPTGFTPMKAIILLVTNPVNVLQVDKSGIGVTGQAVFNVKNNNVTLKVYDDEVNSNMPTERYISDFSYFTEDPFPTNLN